MFRNAIVEMSCKERRPKRPLIVQKAICLVHFDHKKSGTSKPKRIACRMSYQNFKFKVLETGTSNQKQSSHLVSEFQVQGGWISMVLHRKKGFQGKSSAAPLTSTSIVSFQIEDEVNKGRHKKTVFCLFLVKKKLRPPLPLFWPPQFSYKDFLGWASPLPP